MRLGIHTSIAGSLEDAALRAAELGANTFQIFSSSPRMWAPSQPDREDIRRLSAARERFDLYPLAIHVNYLVNLAAADPRTRAMSIEAFRGELRRAGLIGAEFLVLHPGSHRGRSVEEGIEAFALGLRQAAKGLRFRGVTILLESAAGAGAQIGGRFEELRALHDRCREQAELPVGYCLDTCHLLVAGYDIATRAGLRDTLRAAEIVLGLPDVCVVHANDSKAPLASRVDRHANIGEGFIGEDAFHRILTHPKLRGKPFILETPVAAQGDDRRNLNTLKRLAARPYTVERRVFHKG